MKTLILITCGNFLALPQSALSQRDVLSDSLQTSTRVFVDAGYNPLGASDSWGPRYSIRLACHLPSFTLSTHDLNVNVIYTQYGLEDEWATGVQHVEHYPSVRRQDLAVYLSTRASFLEFGLGIAFVRSDKVRILASNNHLIEEWPYGGLSKLTYFATFGLVGEISLGGSLFLPLGLHYVLPTDHARVPFLFRGGIGYAF